MSKRKRRHKKSESKRRSALEDHKRDRKRLLPPLAQLPISTISWVKDLLPELLWVDSIVAANELNSAADIIHETLDMFDTAVPVDSQDVITGLVSSFELVPIEIRETFKKELVDKGVFELAFSKKYLSIIGNHPQCPMYWLAEGENISSQDLDNGLGYLKEAIIRLFPSRTKHPSRCRMFPIARLAKNGKLFLTRETADIVDLLVGYSDKMDEEKQLETESIVRAMFISFHQMVASKAWASDFWRRNYEISPCEPQYQTDPSGLSLRFSPALLNKLLLMTIDSLLKKIRRVILSRRRRRSLLVLSRALDDIMKVFQEATGEAVLDTYDLDRDDVLFGLVSRQFHLYFLIVKDTRLWIPEYGLLFHRIMADTYIIVSWLSKRNDPQLFQHFKTYSLGKQKLYKLHLEDLRLKGGSDTRELEEMLTEKINEEIREEFLPIDLGAAFEGTSIREMAIESGLKEVYDLVYAPTSSEVHGE